MNSGTLATIGDFTLCAAAIAYAGARLCHYGDAIAEASSLSRGAVGILLLATVTSLPELVTGLAAVTVAGVPDIAIGDVLGSCVFNLAILGAILLLPGGERSSRRPEGAAGAAAFAIPMLGLVTLGILAPAGLAWASIGHVGPYSPVLVLLYVLALRTVLRGPSGSEAPVGLPPEIDGRMTLRRAVAGYTAWAVVVLAAGIRLPFAAAALAEAMGWTQHFMGTLFVAAATSVPEVAVSIAAVRIGALDLAVGNVLGSNLFNMVILAIDDLAFVRGPVLAHVSPMHAVSAISAAVMTGGIAAAWNAAGSGRPVSRHLLGFGLIAMYALNSYLLAGRG
jgi:cation:H+ antiporter